MSKSLDDLLTLLTLEMTGPDVYRGRSPQVGWQRVFGGLVVSQALVACTRTVPVEEWAPHSLHAYFILPGDPSTPIDYHVERIRDGKSFSTRRCVARQGGRSIFTLSASFHVAESGFAHQFPMPEVPPPESLPNETEIIALLKASLPEPVRHYFERERPIELRPIESMHNLSKDNATPRQNIWMRAVAPLPDDLNIHRAVLAYLSDLTLLGTALRAHGHSFFESTNLQLASLDHALWFHRPFRADDWLLYAQDSPVTAHALGFTRGLLYTRTGELVASVCQEGLMRTARKPSP